MPSALDTGTHPFAQPSGPAGARGIARVDELQGRDAFLALRAEWNALVEETSAQIFVRHEVLQLWLEHFARGAELRVLVARDAAGGLCAALPLVEARDPSFGPLVRVWSSPTNDHPGRFDLIARDPHEAAHAFVAHLRAREGWDMVRLWDVPPDAKARALIDAARTAGLETVTQPLQRSPYLTLPSSPEALEAAWSKNLRSGLRRRRRRLAEQGPLRLDQVHAQTPNLPRLLLEAFELEASGWKGKEGTAILQDPRTHAYYAGLATWAADTQRLSLSVLRVGERAVAFDLGLVDGGRYHSLKHGYDEAFRTCSPGQLITEDLLRGCVERGLREFDFMGEDDPCKRDWTATTRTLDFLFLFNRTAGGRLLRAAKTTVGPLLKRLARALK